MNIVVLVQVIATLGSKPTEVIFDGVSLFEGGYNCIRITLFFHLDDQSKDVSQLFIISP